MRTRRPSRATLAFALAVAVAAMAWGPAAADDVHLTNGKVFEGVIAEVAAGRVTVHLPAGGQIVLDRSLVRRVDVAVSPLAGYRERHDLLAGDPEASADDWLRLALWARRQDLRHGYREAALEAARRDPLLRGVAAAMHELGFVLDETLGRWLPENEAMQRRGLVQLDGEWVTREERDRRFAAQQAAAEEARDRRLDRIADLLATQAEIELARAAAEAARPAAGLAAQPVAYPVVSVPYYYPRSHAPVRRPAPRPAPPGPAAPEPPQQVPPSSNHGGFEGTYGRPVHATDYIPGRLNPDVATPPGQLGSGR
jgi:hypothetical protein